MWDRIKALLGISIPPQASGSAAVTDLGDALLVRVRCNRCQEQVEARLRKASDIQPNYDGDDFAYFVQKTLVGRSCFNRIDVRLEFDSKYRLLDSEVRGGELLAESSNDSR